LELLAYPISPLYVKYVSYNKDNIFLIQVFPCSVFYPLCWYSSFFYIRCKPTLPFHALLNPSYSIISVITPAPTVLPPSLIAKRVSFSNATGAMSSTVISTLSPGITISTPSGSFTVPVTSVVLT